MARQKKPDRVIGVYDEPGGRGRIKSVVDGKPDNRFYPTKKEAETAARALQKKLSLRERSVKQAREAWFLDRKKFVQPSTLVDMRVKLREIVPDDLDDEPLSVFTRAKCVSLYNACCESYAVATQHRALPRLQDFFKWCIEKGWMPHNPAEGIKLQGEARRGKPQHTEDQARVWLNKGLSLWSSGNLRAAAPVCCLLFGCRVSEILSREVQHLDRGGELLIISKAKSPAGVRRLVVPEVIRGLLREMAGERPYDALLFPAQLGIDVWRSVHWLCRESNTPKICTHSLRGMHATFAIEAGETGRAVAAQLGHTSEVIGERSYIMPGTKEAQRQKKAQLRLLGNGTK